MAWTLWVLGYPDRATTQMAAALDRADEIEHPHTHAYCLYYASVLSALRREFAVARQNAERCLSLSEQHGFGLWRNLARIVSALSANLLDNGAVKLEEIRAELDDHVRRGQRMGITVLYALLCRALIEQGKASAASDAADEAQKIGRATEELLFETEFCRVKAQAVLIGGLDASSNAQTMLEQALEIARRQDARSIELLVVRDLAALWWKRGRREKARDLLSQTYAWFTEGFDTPDLKNAKALLEALDA
jgi:hypothetical protein